MIEIDVTLYPAITVPGQRRASRVEPYKFKARAIALRRVTYQGRFDRDLVQALAYIPEKLRQYVSHSDKNRVCDGLCWLHIDTSIASPVVADFISSGRLELLLEGA
ncbi:hypothetical protein [Paraburkholderia sp. 2C]